MKSGTEPQPLGSRAFVIAGQSPEGKYYNDSGQGLPFYQGKKDFGERELLPPTVWTSKTTKETQAGDILMSVRAPVGPINFAREAVCIGRGLAAIRCRDGLDPDFLFYQLLGMQAEIAGKEGAVFASINKAEIEALPVVVPALAEQRRIVAILDEAFEGIATAKANAEKNLQNARELFELQLAMALRQGGEDWVEMSMSDACTLRSGTTVPVEIERSAGDIPYVKVAEMTMPANRDGVTTSIRFLNRADIKPAWLIPAGAVIFPKRGGAILTNKKRLALVDICVDLNIMSVIPSEKLTSEFLYLYFLTVDMRKLGTGSSIPQINNYDIAPLLISFPASKARQVEVTEDLRAMETECQTLVALYERKLTDLDELKRSLLHRAFTGSLTDRVADRQVTEVA